MSTSKYARPFFVLSVAALVCVLCLTLRWQMSNLMIQFKQNLQSTFRESSQDNWDTLHAFQIRIRASNNVRHNTRLYLNQSTGNDLESDQNNIKKHSKQFGPKSGGNDLLNQSQSEYQKENNSRTRAIERTTFANVIRHASPMLRTVKYVDRLAATLTQKIRVAASNIKEVQLQPTCASNATLADSCDGQKTCLSKNLPTDIKERVSQLVNPVELQLSKDIQNVLKEMGRNVSGHYDVILLTAGSSNHYLETQAMIKSVHDNVIPVIKNFTFIFYNLGLSATERQEMVKNCKCHVVDFPFEKFPSFMRTLQCYSWKPIIIKAHVQQANVAIWADASIRFHNNSAHLRTLIEQTRHRGIQLGWTRAMSPFRTLKSMYHFFGDEPCAYLQMKQAAATAGFYTPDLFVDRVILEPWVACAVHKDCMCELKGTMYQTKDCTKSLKLEKNWKLHDGPISYGMCHRFDQSAISLILHKLYQGYYTWVIVNMVPYLDIRRDDKLDFFSKT